MIKSFRDLNVYRKAFDISIEIHGSTRKFPREELYSLTSQIRRSSKSVCANIAEGFAKQKNSKAEFKRFALIAFGSANETLVWIEYCHKLGYITEEQTQRWDEEYNAISKMLQSLHSKS